MSVQSENNWWSLSVPASLSEVERAIESACDGTTLKIAKRELSGLVVKSKSKMNHKYKYRIVYRDTEDGCCMVIYPYWSSASNIGDWKAGGNCDTGVARILSAIKRSVPEFDVDCSDCPRVQAVCEVGSGVDMVSTTQGASVSGAVLGGILFGGAGAVVGSMVPSRTTATSQRMSSTPMVEIVLSNGRHRFEQVRRGGRKWQELSVFMIGGGLR